MNSITRYSPATLGFAAALVASIVWRSSTPSMGIAKAGTSVSSYRVVNVYPHDPTAYTQGLVYRDGFLFESTGLNGESSLRKVRLDTGEVVQRYNLDPEYFAEGLTEMDGQLIQLTWRSNAAFVYDLATFARRRTFRYSGEGWGLTHNKREFILSDGTEYLRFYEPKTFRETRRLAVTDAGVPVKALNELEYVGGEVYANVWHTDRIARVSPESGRVIGWIDLRGILSPVHLRDTEAVLNGIAYDESRDRLFVTGKLWPKLFEVTVVPPNSR